MSISSSSSGAAGAAAAATASPIILSKRKQDSAFNEPKGTALDGNRVSFGKQEADNDEEEGGPTADLSSPKRSRK